MTVEQFEVVWKLAAIVFGAGVFYAELKAIRKDIKRLEIKADESNHLKERVAVLEIKVEDIGKEKELWAGKN